jgi:hypothetical protein
MLMYSGGPSRSKGRRGPRGRRSRRPAGRAHRVRAAVDVAAAVDDVTDGEDGADAFFTKHRQRGGRAVILSVDVAEETKALGRRGGHPQSVPCARLHAARCRGRDGVLHRGASL